MSKMTVVNTVANSIMVMGFSAFLVFLFGRENSLIHKLGKVNNLIVKGVLSMCATLALYNAITMDSASRTGTLMNVSIAILFCWAAVFHYFRFVRSVESNTGMNKTGARKVTKRVK
jgi:uncharacterized membrane protein (GlpM family)